MLDQSHTAGIHITYPALSFSISYAKVLTFNLRTCRYVNYEWSREKNPLVLGLCGRMRIRVLKESPLSADSSTVGGVVKVGILVEELRRKWWWRRRRGRGNGDRRDLKGIKGWWWVSPLRKWSCQKQSLKQRTCFHHCLQKLAFFRQWLHRRQLNHGRRWRRQLGLREMVNNRRGNNAFFTI